MRVELDTTVLWGAFHSPSGPCFSLLALAAQRTPVLDGFITDVIGAEFWWRATQQGVRGPGQRVARTYTRVLRPRHLAGELGLIDTASTAARVAPDV